MKTYFAAGVQPLFVLMWSSAFIAGIIGVGAAPSMTVLFARFGIAGVLLAAYSMLVRVKWPRGRELGHVIVAGLLLQIVQFGGFYSAMGQHVPGAVIALIQGLSPVVIALFAGFLGESITPRQWFGFAIGGVGVALAVLDKTSFSLAGLLLCVTGLLGLSLGTIYQKRYVSGVDPKAATSVHLLISAPVAGIIAWATGQLHVYDVVRFSGAIAWMVLLNSIAAFLLYFWMLRRMDATRVSRLLFVTPAVTAVAAWLIVGQPLHPLTIAGLAIGLAGMMFASRKPSAEPVRQPGPAAVLAVR
ncbi:DMT family transporter [Nocardia arthritidis]|uniref:EamA family transporter n=1 Tax=Nocardia arthritidis TaxID=228602 RepID=A0A6G9YTT1_9NOCA|nr:DMT family transporter [Nocardia arthritidis]QIS16739.1 EamA family transporter [Nocardia arthritidis]